MGLKFALIAAVLATTMPTLAQGQVVLTDKVKLEIQSYTDCIGTKASEQLKSADASDVVVDRAMAFCQDWPDMLREDLVKPPMNASLAEAEQAVRQMRDQLRKHFIKTLTEARLMAPQ